MNSCRRLPDVELITATRRQFAGDFSLSITAVHPMRETAVRRLVESNAEWAVIEVVAAGLVVVNTRASGSASHLTG
jgi:hypothetical protein